MKIKISIADDHPIVLSGVQRLLADHSLFEVCHVASSGDTLLNNLCLQLPDVLLLDIQMPGHGGDEMAAIIGQRYPELAILVLTNLDQPFHVRNMFSKGVRGYLLKSADQYTLVEAIDRVYKGKQYLDPALKKTMLYADLEGRKSKVTPTLSRREQEILELISEGLTSGEIAKRLFVTLSTVENHRINLFFKLGVKNAVSVVKKGIQMGFIK